MIAFFLRDWRGGWEARLPKNPDPELELPPGTMKPAGYIVLGHGVRLGRPVKAYQRWIGRIPKDYRESVLKVDEPAPSVEADPYCRAAQALPQPPAPVMVMPYFLDL
jgi:chromosome partitioning protein